MCTTHLGDALQSFCTRTLTTRQQEMEVETERTFFSQLNQGMIG
uniref:Uncharacterized protein n=1 Tax=Anguilla anguilla TaxID=7936 RepID=A0A0E9RAW2_ANGAN